LGEIFGVKKSSPPAAKKLFGHCSDILIIAGRKLNYTDEN
jgi:hypothetical protein